jgi:hypothetical protein
VEVVVAGEFDVVGDGVGGGGGVELEVFVVGVVDLVGEGGVAFGAGGSGHAGRESICVVVSVGIGGICFVFQSGRMFTTRDFVHMLSNCLFPS